MVRALNREDGAALLASAERGEVAEGAARSNVWMASVMHSWHPGVREVLPTGFPDPLGGVVKYSLAPTHHVAKPLRLANPPASALQALQEATIEGRSPDVSFGETISGLPRPADGYLPLALNPKPNALNPSLNRKVTVGMSQSRAGRS